MSKKPKYSDAIEIRHAKRVQATKERLNRKQTSLTAGLKAIDEEIKQDPNNRDLRKESVLSVLAASDTVLTF